MTFRVFVTNSPSLYDTKQPSFFVTPYNYPPVITLGANQCFKVFRTDTIYLDAITTAHDPNDPLSSLSWSFSKGHHFKVDSLYSLLLAKQSNSPATALSTLAPGIIIPPVFSRFNRHIVIDTISAADTAFHGTDTLIFKATDPGGLSTTKQIFFTRPTGLCLFIIY